MVKIHKLKHPNKHSGFKLVPGKTTTVRGMVITNNNKHDVYVDKFTRKPWKKPKKASSKTASSKKVAPKKEDSGL